MIEIEELYKYYGERRVVGPLSARIEKGEIVGLLGLNGAGKTTTLRVLACDLLPTSGSVRIGGHDVVERPHEVRGKVGYLPDRPPLYDDMTVDEYLGYAARLKRVPKNDVAKRVAEVEEMTELGDVKRQLVGTLSHGYRQRLGIAQAIVHRPELVVLDEPIGGLDPLQIVEMRGLVRGLRGEHTVIVSSHILHEISETCDRIFVIQKGEILWSGREADLSSQVEQGMRIRVTVRMAGKDGAAALERATELATAVAGVRSVEAREATEPGDGIASIEVLAESDVRDALCRALVAGDAGVLEVARLRDLETTFRALLEGGAPS
ncbi:MAG TPA: ABC transporter ATP-binding protein [Polyangiaceae bacterium]|nr:ABC transporter ATP-binding protein [Polyangiaceae bacterium]